MTMPFELVTIPCRSDNYAFLLRSEDGKTALVDAPDAAPIMSELERRGWTLDEIWLTHHHIDHVSGVEALRGAYPNVVVVGASADARRLPPLDRKHTHGQSFEFGGAEVHVFDVSGHTVGHIAYHVPDAKAVFTGDSLMAMGCGRVFEGTPTQMWRSLGRITTLPDDTLVCSGHEYTAENARFALTVDADNPALHSRIAEIKEARDAGRPTVPSLLSLEKETNPFLRAPLSEVKAHLNMDGATDVESFAEIRRRKDRF